MELAIFARLREPRGRAWFCRALGCAFALAAGGFASLSIMAADRSWTWGVPIGFVGTLAAALGLLGLFGGFRAPGRSAARSTAIAELRAPLVRAAVALAAACASLRAATAGWVPRPAAGLMITAALLALLWTFFRVGEVLGPFARDERGEARPLFRRHGFWLMSVAILLYVPTLGSFSLIDPWETHYGEVAREMLARDDWISTWTPQAQPVSGWFWSKPVLDMWMQALAMAALGVGYLPGEMLAGAEAGRAPAPEWAVRLPACALSLVALYALYKAVARVCGRRAGFTGALVLATTSQWFLVAHQSITDMPFVATLSISLSLTLLALHTDPDAVAPSYEVRFARTRLRIGMRDVVLGVVVATALAQILYLASRNVELQWVASPHGYRPHADEFWSGSKGNCGIPGNPPCLQQTPAHGFEPVEQAALWLATLVALLALNRNERRTQRLLMLGAWYAAAIATLGKGAAGFAFPAMLVLAYLAITARWSALLALEIPSGLAILAAVALPWYVAMYVRHGHPFTDELIFRHMYKRALEHLHDVNVGDDVSFRYYVWQLGYALFPWTGFLPAAFVLRGARPGGPPRDDALSFLGTWFVLAFGLFSAMPTKFHHYILPAVPPAALLVGVVIDRALGASNDDRHADTMAGAAALGGAILTALIGRDLVTAGGDVRGASRLLALFTYDYRRPWPDSLHFERPLAWTTGVVAGAMLLFAVRRVRPHAARLLLAAALVYTVWALDVYLPACAPHWGQRELFATYRRLRSGPGEPIIAYRMNWLGEYFYSSNRLPAFGLDGSSSAAIGQYVRSEVDRGTTTFFFVTDHAQASTLKNELGSPSSFERLTDATLNNKFVLLRARFDVRPHAP